MIILTFFRMVNSYTDPFSIHTAFLIPINMYVKSSITNLCLEAS